ncbi:hypothetical protein ACNOYE_29175 [Nannocystaceae bacterium ST9]
MSNPDPEVLDQDRAPAGSFRVLRLLRWTVPLHAALPLVIAWLGWAWEREMTWAWWIVHVGFAGALAWGYPWWRGQGEAVAAVVVINHLVMVVVAMALAAWAWG